MRLLICGSRNWSDPEPVRREILARRNQIEVVIHGAARGADTLTGEIATELGIPVLEFPANWKAYGKSAGPKRNTQMITEGRPDMVLAFTSDLGQSHGTRNMVKQAMEAGIPTKVINS